MKKLLVSLLLIAACTALALSLCACNKKHEHSYSKTTVQPTCTEVGYVECTCACGDIYIEEFLPTLDHSFSNWQTDGNGNHVKECVYGCGEKQTEQCSGGNATCVKGAVCEVCSGEYGALSNTHLFGNWQTDGNGNHIKECVYGCGEKQTVPCTEACTVCGTDGIEYASDGTFAKVIGYSGSATEIIIGMAYNGLPVTSIGNFAFARCDGLTSVVIPDSVTSIGNFAFAYCNNLTSVVIGDSVTSIGEKAFAGCESLTSVVIPDSVTSIGYFAFYDCDGLTSVVIGDSVTYIGDEAFAGCESLTSVVIPDSVTSIGYSAFYNCESFTSVVIPDSVTSIGGYAFARCSKLTNITVSEGNPAYKSVDGNLYTKDGSTLVQYALGKKAASFTIPDFVTYIGNSAFESCESLTSVVIGDSVTYIGNYAFEYCYNLTSVVIGDSVTSIGERAFSSCSKLTNITVSEGNPAYKSVDGNLYTKDGSKLVQYALGKKAASFTIPEFVTYIGNYAFEYCYNLTSVVIGDSVTSIGNYAFYDCYNLTSVYFKRTAEEWNAIAIGFYNTDLTDAAIYYYSEYEPALNAGGTAYDGNYWRYVDGVPTAWVKQN